jgi:hypothetical protein
VSRVWRGHAAEERQGSRVRVLQGLPSTARSNDVGLARACNRPDALVGGPARPAPDAYDWSRTHARRRGGEALDRLARGEWPTASVVSNLFGTWATARAAASGEDVGAAQTGRSEPLEVIGHTGDLYAQSPVIARKIRRSEEVRRLA